MKLLPITGKRNGKIGIVVGYTKVDDDDYEKLKNSTINFCGEYKRKLYVESRKLGRIHRYIMNCPKGMEVDHINGDKLDNRKGNLRICTHSENEANKGIQKNNASGHKDIYWEKSTNKWNVKIKFNGKTYKKRFGTINEAINHRNKMIKIIHGEFARIN